MFTSLRQGARQALTPKFSLGYLAGLLLILASGAANVRHGLQLGSGGLDTVIAVAASIGADVYSAVGFTLAATFFAAGRWGRGSAATVALVLTLSYAIVAGLGFASSTKGAVVGAIAADVRADKITEERFKTAKTEVARLEAIQKPTKKQQRELADEKAKRDSFASKLQSTKTLAAADPLGENLATYLGTLGIETSAGALAPWLNLLFVLLVVLGGPIAIWVSDPVREPASVDNQQTQQTPTDETKKTKLPLTTFNSPTDGGAHNDNPSVVIRPRQVESITPTASRALTRLKAMGGSVEAKSQAEIATQLKLPRTSARRVLDRLEGANAIRVTHGPAGYRVAVAA